MVSPERARSILKSTGWLSQQPEAFQAAVLRRCALMHFSAGDVIYRFGDPIGGVYGLVAGAVTVTLAPPVQVPRLLHIGLAGSWIGEGGFLVREPRRIGVHTAVETWMMHLSLEDMDRIASQDPLAVRYFTKMLILNLDILVRAFYDLQNPDDDRRVALALLRIASRPNSPIPLSQSDLGTMSGVSRKQVNAALKRFVAAGCVSTRYRSITVRNVEALSQIAHGGD